MAQPKYVAYYRVSTAKQGASGLGLEAQQVAVRTYLQDASMVDEVIEVETGKKADRPGLLRALSLCRLHKATLIIAKLDRLARNVHFISGLMNSDVEFVAVDFPLANRLTIHILAAVAEYEVSLISARTKAALLAAKARGIKLGTPRHDQIAQHAAKGLAASMVARAAKAQKLAADILPVIVAVEAAGAQSLRQIADQLNLRGIPAARGGQWSAVQVSRVMFLA
jgi:DNA invertase Pin-like site-specific DNA recombinase